MNLRVIVAWCAGVTLFLIGSGATAQADPGGEAAVTQATCEAITGVDFAHVQDAPTVVETAVWSPSSAAAPGRCRVRGLVAPDVGFEIVLPASAWNGKIIEIGCVGMCGDIITTPWCEGPLRRGYACFTTDMGHHSMPGTAVWALDDPRARADFGYRAAHVGLLASRAIIAHAYGRAPWRSYFYGCSTGGYQGLVEAQRYPWDFDGIVALAPDMNETDLALTTIWTARQLTRPDGKSLLSADNLSLIHQAALKACGRSDGVLADVTGDPRTCKFDPGTLVCSGAPNCLTQEQADAVRRVYAGPSSRGAPTTYSGGYAPGSELAWNDVNVATKPSDWALDFFRYALFSPAPGPSLKPSDIDFDSDFKRLGGAVEFVDTDPDLRRFKAAGGKLIVAQGWADQYEPPLGPVRYYEAVERLIGGRNPTQAFFRLFMVPGMQHCSGGPGAFAVDYLAYLEDWSERGRPPGRMVAAHVPHLAWYEALGLRFPLSPDVKIDFTRPLFPYPFEAVYRVPGDRNDAASFTPRRAAGAPEGR